MTWRFKKRSKRLFYLYSFLYEDMFDSEFSSPQKETMTTEVTSHNDCLNWLKDRKLPVLRDSQQCLIFLPKSFFFSANFFLLNSYPQHWPASRCVTSTSHRTTTWRQERREPSSLSVPILSMASYLFNAFFIMRPSVSDMDRELILCQSSQCRGGIRQHSRSSCLYFQVQPVKGAMPGRHSVNFSTELSLVYSNRLKSKQEFLNLCDIWLPYEAKNKLAHN